MPAPVEKFYPIRLTVTGELDGATVLPAQTTPIVRAAGTIDITTVNLGVLDPSLLGADSNDSYFLSLFYWRGVGNGGVGGSVDVIDANGDVIEQVADLNGVAAISTQAGFIIPPEARFLLDDQAVQVGHVLWFDLWRLDTTEDGIFSSGGVT